MHEGHSGVRGTDISAIKETIIPMLSFVFPEAGSDTTLLTKECRGFQNKWTGYLLCPINLDWSDEKCEISLLNLDPPPLIYPFKGPRRTS